MYRKSSQRLHSPSPTQCSASLLGVPVCEHVEASIRAAPCRQSSIPIPSLAHLQSSQSTSSVRKTTDRTIPSLLQRTPATWTRPPQLSLPLVRVLRWGQRPPRLGRG